MHPCSQSFSQSCSHLYSQPTAGPAPHEYTVTVQYKHRSCDISVRPDETLLAALERHQASLESLGLPNSMIPSDCRRGNCLTCTGTLLSGGTRSGSEFEHKRERESESNSSNSNNANSPPPAWVSDGDGLSPHISETVRERGYLLTCSTRVAGEGLVLELGQNQAVWKDIYQTRLDVEPTREEKWAAMAGARRRSDERNKARWKEETGALLGE